MTEEQTNIDNIFSSGLANYRDDSVDVRGAEGDAIWSEIQKQVPATKKTFFSKKKIAVVASVLVLVAAAAMFSLVQMNTDHQDEFQVVGQEAVESPVKKEVVNERENEAELEGLDMQNDESVSVQDEGKTEKPEENQILPTLEKDVVQGKVMLDKQAGPFSDETPSAPKADTALNGNSQSRLFPDSAVATESIAEESAEQRGKTYIKPGTVIVKDTIVKKMNRRRRRKE